MTTSDAVTPTNGASGLPPDASGTSHINMPRALVILLGTVSSFNLPAEPVFIILGIDALMDMARTATNVLGNCLATVVVARWEGVRVE